MIALAVRGLPPRARLLGRVWGTAGAVGLRLAFIAIASQLLALPYLQAVGGILLIWIAVRLVLMDADGGHTVRQGVTLREAIWIIMVADAAMSLDNVLAVAAAAHGDFLLVVIGIGLSLPLVVWGSGFLAWLMSRHRWIIWIGGGVLGWVAGEMIVTDTLERWLDAGDWSAALPALPALSVAALGWRAQRRRPAPRV